MRDGFVGGCLLFVDCGVLYGGCRLLCLGCCRSAVGWWLVLVVGCCVVLYVGRAPVESRYVGGRLCAGYRVENIRAVTRIYMYFAP